MDRVTRCLHCGKRMMPAPGLSGRTELICVYCEKTDAVEIAEAVNWSDRPLPNGAFGPRP